MRPPRTSKGLSRRACNHAPPLKVRLASLPGKPEQVLPDMVRPKHLRYICRPNWRRLAPGPRPVLPDSPTDELRSRTKPLSAERREHREYARPVEDKRRPKRFRYAPKGLRCPTDHNCG